MPLPALLAPLPALPEMVPPLLALTPSPPRPSTPRRPTPWLLLSTLLPPAHRIQRPVKARLRPEPPVLQRAMPCLLAHSRILKPKPSSSPSTIRGSFRPSRFLSTLLRAPRSAERSPPSLKFKKTCTCPPACRLISKARPHRFATRSPTCRCSSWPPSLLST